MADILTSCGRSFGFVWPSEELLTDGNRGNGDVMNGSGGFAGSALCRVAWVRSSRDERRQRIFVSEVGARLAGGGEQLLGWSARSRITRALEDFQLPELRPHRDLIAKRLAPKRAQ